MRTSGWMKRQPWFWPAKLFLKRLSGRELWLKPTVDADTVEAGGWNFIADQLDENSVALCLGVGDSVEFDLALIEETGATVHALDPTPYAKEWVAEQTLPKTFIFHAWAAAAEDGSLRLYRRVNQRGKRADVMWTADSSAGDESDSIDAPAYSYTTLLKKLNQGSVDLMKMDIEGAEFDLLEGLQAGDHLPTQLLVEFHHRFPGIGKARAAACIAHLRSLGYEIFDVSETGREVGFLMTNAVRV